MKGYIELTHLDIERRSLISIEFIGTVGDCGTFTRIMFRKTNTNDGWQSVYEFKETYDEVKRLIAEATGEPICAEGEKQTKAVLEFAYCKEIGHSTHFCPYLSIYKSACMHWCELRGEDAYVNWWDTDEAEGRSQLFKKCPLKKQPICAQPQNGQKAGVE